MSRFGVFVLTLGLLTFSWGVAQAAVFKTGNAPSFDQPIHGDLFTAGQDISVATPLDGELFAMGNTISASKSLGRSAFVAGNTINLREGVGYNVYATGNTITLSGKIGHDVYAMGNSLIIEDGSEIDGDVYAAGNSIVLKGSIHGDVHLGAQSVTSSAKIGGTVDGQVEKLTFTGGSIGGDLNYTATKDADGLATVTVTGKTQRTDPKSDDRSPTSTRNLLRVWIFATLTMLVLGAVLLLLMPARIEALAIDLNQHRGKRFLLGLAILVLTFPVVLLLYLTMVGWPVAILAGLVTMILALVAKGVSGILVGQWAMRWLKLPAQWWEALLIGVIGLALLSLIPFLGPLVMLIVFFGVFIPAVGGLAEIYWTGLRSR